MLLLLVTALVGQWRYEGFTSAPAGAGPEPAARLVPTVAAPAVVPPTPTSTPPPPNVKVDAPAPPTLWRLADAGGQIWEHANPEWLRFWVGEHNASLTLDEGRPRTPIVAEPGS